MTSYVDASRQLKIFCDDLRLSMRLTEKGYDLEGFLVEEATPEY